jgi:membrane protein DedA with SNARE-associated domain
MAFLGAVIGDFLSYWVGYTFRFKVRGWWPLATRPYLMAAADRFFERYGSYSVALCRFIPVMRSLVPLVAGISGMPRRRFLIANVASALIWAPAHVCPAQMAGVAVERLRAGEWQSAVYLAAGVVVFGVAAWMLHRRLSPLAIAARR